MRATLVFSALVGAVWAQSTATVPTGPPMGVYKTASNVPAVTATTLTGVAIVTSAPKKRAVEDVAAIKRRSFLERRTDLCVAQPAGMNYSTTPDDPATFQKDSVYSTAANMAPTPNGYNQTFKNIVASNTAPNYLGFTFLTSYDVASCASQCDAQSGCASFNIYFERDPTLSPDPNLCPNPASLTQIKCVWWGGLVSLDNANNYGQQIASFVVAIAGNNGYQNIARAQALQAATTTTTAGAIATQTATAGSIWLVYYSADTSQNAYTSAQAANTYQDCMVACDADPSCQAFTYVGVANGTGAGTCWLKSALGNPTVASNTYISAVRAVSNGAAASSVVSSTISSSTTPVVVSSTSSYSTASAPQLNYPVYGTQTLTSQYISTVTYSPGAGSASSAPTSSSSTTASTPLANAVASSSSSSSSSKSITQAYPTASAASTVVSSSSSTTQAYTAASSSAAASSTAQTSPAASSTTAKAVTTSAAAPVTTPAPAVTTTSASSISVSTALNYNAQNLNTCPTGETQVTATDGSTWAVCNNADYSGDSLSWLPSITDASVCASLCVANIKCVAAVMDVINSACILKSTASGALVWNVNTQYRTVRQVSAGPLAALTTVKTMTTAVATSTTTSAPSILPTSSAPAQGFLLQMGTKITGISAYVTFNTANGRMQYTVTKSKATTFYLDSNGALRTWSSTAAYNGLSAMTDASTGAWQKVALRSSIPSGSDQASCQFSNGLVVCNQQLGLVWAGTCLLDGYIYFGQSSQIPWGCGWVGLYPVSISS